MNKVLLLTIIQLKSNMIHSFVLPDLLHIFKLNRRKETGPHQHKFTWAPLWGISIMSVILFIEHSRGSTLACRDLSLEDLPEGYHIKWCTCITFCIVCRRTFGSALFKLYPNMFSSGIFVRWVKILECQGFRRDLLGNQRHRCLRANF